MAIDGRMAEPAEDQRVDLTVVPAVFEHAVRVYREMQKHSAPDKESGLMVYEGHLTNLFKKLLLSVPYYTLLKNQLIGMGCIEQIRRGGGNATSRWVLWKEPELDAWKDFTPKRARRGNATQQMAGQIKDLHERVNKLEELCAYMARMMPDRSWK